MLYGLASLMVALFGVIQWMRYGPSHGADSEPYTAIVLVLAAATTPIVLGVWLPRIQREIDRQAERERQLRQNDSETSSHSQRNAL